MPDSSEGRVALSSMMAAATAAGGVVLLLAWWVASSADTVDGFAAWFAPHRHAWYALPGVALTFVALGLVLVPVMLLVAATGVAFGPWLGPVYAMAGCLASASVGFAIGRWVGRDRVQQLAGERLSKAAGALARQGILAVFLWRKVPVPFTLANVIAGATPLRYRDFIVGTMLGMMVGVVGLAAAGYQLAKVLDDPSPQEFGFAALVVGLPLTAAVLLTRSLRTRENAP